MGKTLNKVQIIGRLGKDPEIRYTQGSGTAVATLSVATDEGYKDKQSGEWQKKTEWHRVIAWERTAEIAGEYLQKGSQVYIEGKLQTRSWDDKNGNKQYTTEIVARDLILLGGRGDSSGNYPPPPGDADAPAYTGKPKPQEQTNDEPPPADNMPF